MSNFPAITFSTSMSQTKGTIVFLVSDKHGDKPKLPASAAKFDADNRITNALSVADFKGAVASVVEILAPAKGLDRILVAGIGKSDGTDENEWMKIGGKIMASMGKSTEAMIVTELAEKGVVLAPEAIAAMAAGAKLRTYSFDTYKTKNKDKPKSVKLSFAGSNAAAAKKSWAIAEAVADGVVFARDLMDEPANILGPVEFAKRAAELKKLGCEIEILDEKKLKTEKMGALLGVAQGSVRPARVVIMRWKGGKASAKPVAFVGKGVVFDTGGISIKPAAGMEDMKGDMGGAAAVCGVMHALAARKAKVNAVGIIGLVENMPDANAQRPGDIVVSRSGQTIEVLNTDAEGRLVLADLLWYCEDKYKPQFMVNLATLTGAIIIALGNTHAGLFSNSDELSERLAKAGKDTAELLWRMPLAAEYDKLIDSKNADMKNIGGRHAGSITAAQFLQRFVRDAQWAHLDIAGTAMGSPKTEYSQGWASGFGVRLLNRLVANHYE